MVREAVAGGVLVGLVFAAALWFRANPAQTFVDNWGSSLVHPDPHASVWVRVTDLRSPAVLGVGSVLAAAVVVGRDRWRALACLVGPVLAVVLTEYLLKPVIARRYTDLLSFPSGTTTAVAALATAWVLAVPRRWRPAVAAVGVVLVALECIAVVALQYHFATDALGGTAIGVGVLLLLDGGILLVVAAIGRGGPAATRGPGAA